MAPSFGVGAPSFGVVVLSFGVVAPSFGVVAILWELAAYRLELPHFAGWRGGIQLDSLTVPMDAFVCLTLKQSGSP